MFIDACALVAVLADEPESERVSAAIMSAKKRFTSPLAILETALALSRPDKFDLAIGQVEPLIMEFLDARAIEIRDLPPQDAPQRCLFTRPIPIEKAVTVLISQTAFITRAQNTIVSRSWRRTMNLAKPTSKPSRRARLR